MQAIADPWILFPLFIAQIGLVFWLASRVMQMSAAQATGVFMLYSALTGVTLSFVFLAYTAASLTSTFLVTAGTFGAMSFYGYTTKRDLTAMGSFLFMGLIGIIIASVVNIFIGSTMVQFVVSVLGVIIFVGLTAYDTQQIKNMYYAADSGEVVTKKSIMGALRLYLDFLNMFLFLLQLFGNRN